MKNVILNLMLSFSAHLLICLAMTAAIFKLLIPAIPAVEPYAIVFDVCFCLGILSIWYATSIELDDWVIKSYIVTCVLLVIVFIIGLLDWISGLNFIPVPWRYVVVFESLPLASMFIAFILIIVANEVRIKPTKSDGSPQRQPA